DGLYEHFIGKKKIFTHLDIGAFQAADRAALTDRATSLRNDYADALRRLSPWPTLREKATDYTDGEAALLIFRENRANEQISDLVEAHPGATIGVLYGLAHRTMTRRLQLTADEGVSMQRHYAENVTPIDDYHKAYEVLTERNEDAARAGFVSLPDIDLEIAHRIACRFKLGKQLMALSPERQASVIDDLKYVLGNSTEGSTQEQFEKRAESVKSTLLKWLVTT
ncbi:MAG TPA: hypothetical protein VIJ25_17965, partial [Methylococcales bacterium]